ncbi:MAG: hypothetical protein KU37_02610 [Sulfuricurvum sp. PC08-66]|nr:MAG: hypothetical protein KU37_02610 [Sulfuricurvum sp. PC08-66]
MNSVKSLVTLLGGATLALASNDITILDAKSPQFLLGQATHINMLFNAQDTQGMWLKMGIRVQSSLENSVTATDSQWDLYMRRTRLEVEAGFTPLTFFTMDIRNDKVNADDAGEGSFSLGDAYLTVKKPFDTSWLNFKLYRAKIDVSRTQTVKSAYVIMYDRPAISDEAAQFISHNRRATNLQAYGHIDHKIAYQIALGDATQSSKLHDANTLALSKATSNKTITKQSLFVGGSVTLSPFEGWEEKSKTETYFGQGKHAALGIGAWHVPSITREGGDTFSRTLLNLQASAHYEGLFVQAEYFYFDGVVRSWNSALALGQSNGGYVTGEWVIPAWGYIAPFGRYENWNRFINEAGYNSSVKTVGFNWYLRGNTTKLGLNYSLESSNESTFRVTSQWFF